MVKAEVKTSYEIERRQICERYEEKDKDTVKGRIGN